jgi:hypothetical protein
MTVSCATSVGLGEDSCSAVIECVLLPNAPVQLQANQIKAPSEARRNQKIACQLQRSLAGVGD